MPKTRRFAATSILALIHALTSAAPADAHCGVYMTGRWLCKTHDGVVPLDNVRLELWNSNARGSHIFDERMDDHSPVDGSQRSVAFSTQNDGSFYIDGWGGDSCCFWENPDVYVAALLQNNQYPRVSGQHETGIIRSKTTGEHDRDNVCGDLGYLGDFVYDGDAAPGEYTRCENYLEARRIARDYYNVMGNEPPFGETRILTWEIAGGLTYADYDKIRWSISRDPGIRADLTDRAASTVGHEFAHLVHFTSQGDLTYFTGFISEARLVSTHEYCDSHFTAGFLDYQRVRNTFTEGWGDYWEGGWRGCGTCSDGTPCIPIDTPGSSCSNFPCGGNRYVPIQCGCTPKWDDLTNFEGNNARAFRLLETQCNLTRQQLVNIFLNNPGQIETFEEYYAKVRAAHPACTIDLSGVGPTSTPLEHNETHIDHAGELAIDMRNRAVLAQTAWSLKNQYKIARAAAKAPCYFGTADCAGVQIQRWATWGAFKQAELELKRRSRLSKALERFPLPYDPAIGEAVTENRRWFTAELGKVLGKVFSRARAAVGRLIGDYTFELQLLETREREIAEALAAGGDLPRYGYDIVALLGGTTTQVPCGDTYPTCNGACTADQACVSQTIDAPYGCVCATPPSQCGDSAPTCGGICPAGECTTFDGGATCTCYSIP